jgi:hypothetical protein
LLYSYQSASLILYSLQHHFIPSNHLSDDIMIVSICNFYLTIPLLSCFPDY